MGLLREKKLSGFTQGVEVKWVYLRKVKLNKLFQVPERNPS